MMFSLCSGLATYAILTGLTPIVPTHLVVVGMLLINLVLVLAMLVIIAWQVTGSGLPAAVRLPALNCMSASSACSA